MHIAFWFFMLIINTLVPAFMILAGKWLMRGGPSHVNMVSGYRTTRSMKNQETWDFAQKHCGRIWIRWGTVLLPLALVCMLLTLHQTMDVIAIAGGITALIYVTVFIASIFPTERALKIHFDDNGNRR